MHHENCFSHTNTPVQKRCTTTQLRRRFKEVKAPVRTERLHERQNRWYIKAVLDFQQFGCKWSQQTTNNYLSVLVCVVTMVYVEIYIKLSNCEESSGLLHRACRWKLIFLQSLVLNYKTIRCRNPELHDLNTRGRENVFNESECPKQNVCSTRDSLRDGRSGDRTPAGERISTPVQTGPGDHPVSCAVGIGYLSRR